MFRQTGNDVSTKEAVLLHAMIRNPATFECLCVDGAKVQTNAVANLYRRPKRQPVDIAQALCPNFQPVGVVTQRLERMYLD